MFSKLWKDEAGFVTLEYLFGATILAIGLTVGYVALKNSINAELAELSSAILSLNQSYSFSGEFFGACASTGGSQATDVAGSATLGCVAAVNNPVFQAACPCP